MTAWALGLVTMNPTALTTTAAGDMATKWRRFAAVTIVQPVEAATHLCTLTDPHLLLTRCRLFRRSRVLAAHDLATHDLATHDLAAREDR